VIETLQAELAETKDALAETKDVQALLIAQLEATQKHMADMFQIMQTIGQASGVQVQMLAPVPVRQFTPVSMPSCRWDCQPLCRCDFRPSCRWDCRPSCHCFVDLRAVVLLAFVSLFLVGWNPLHAGEVLPKFSILSLTHAISYFVQPPSAGSNNPAIVSPRADPVNPTPQSGPYRSPREHSCTLRRRSRDVEPVIINL
jgi:hypothetical protein